jgi:glycerophosphoryl diester phosphodiesterase
VATGVIVGPSGDIDQAVDECFGGGHRALIPSVELPIPGMAGALESGLEVYPWVVGEQDRVRELAGLGVTGIITDDPDLVRSAVGRQP